MTSSASNTTRQRPSAKKSNSSNDNKVEESTSSKNKTTVVKNKEYDDGTNFVEAGIEANPYLFALILVAPFLSLLLAYVTSEEMATLYPDLARSPIKAVTMLISAPVDCASHIFQAGLSVRPTMEGITVIGSFMFVALALEKILPGKIECGPETATGHIPKYVDNGVLHCIVFTILYYAGSNLGFGNLYDFGILYDTFPPALAFLNIFGMVFCLFLTYKGIYFPSTLDSGSSGSFVKDYLWGTELYPRIFYDLDLKRFINCRFSMTYWQLSGLSFCYRSYVLHDHTMDWGLFFSALSQYLYLVKFFVWEMGYMRSIDIIVDRAGFEIQWGCLVWVPAVYTFHCRFLVQYPSHYSFAMAFILFVVSMTGVLFNYLADRERDVFRATNGKALVWGKAPKFIKATYSIVDRKTGTKTEKTSLLLASGFWGVARHFQYFFELTAAWCWCLLTNPFQQNGILPLFYAIFLTYLLIDRAERDSKKCHLKYGKYYEEYCVLVPYKILPGIY